MFDKSQLLKIKNIFVSSWLFQIVLPSSTVQDETNVPQKKLFKMQVTSVLCYNLISYNVSSKLKSFLVYVLTK